MMAMMWMVHLKLIKKERAIVWTRKGEKVDYHCLIENYDDLYIHDDDHYIHDDDHQSDDEVDNADYL